MAKWVTLISQVIARQILFYPGWVIIITSDEIAGVIALPSFTGCSHCFANFSLSLRSFASLFTILLWDCIFTLMQCLAWDAWSRCRRVNGRCTFGKGEGLRTTFSGCEITDFLKPFASFAHLTSDLQGSAISKRIFLKGLCPETNWIGGWLIMMIKLARSVKKSPWCKIPDKSVSPWQVLMLVLKIYSENNSGNGRTVWRC